MATAWQEVHALRAQLKEMQPPPSANPDQTTTNRVQQRASQIIQRALQHPQHHTMTQTTNQPQQHRQRQARVAPAPGDPFAKPDGHCQQQDHDESELPPRVDWPVAWRVSFALVDLLDRLILSSSTQGHSTQARAAADALISPHCNALRNLFRDHVRQLVDRALKQEAQPSCNYSSHIVNGMATLTSCATIISSLSLHCTDSIFFRLPLLKDALAQNLLYAMERITEHLDALSLCERPLQEVNQMASDSRICVLCVNSVENLLVLFSSIENCDESKFGQIVHSDAAKAHMASGRTFLEDMHEKLKNRLCYTFARCSVCCFEMDAPGEKMSSNVSYDIYMVVFGMHATVVELRELRHKTRSSGGFDHLILKTLRMVLERIVSALWASTTRRIDCDIIFLIGLVVAYCPNLSKLCASGELDPWDSHTQVSQESRNEARRLSQLIIWLVTLLAIYKTPVEEFSSFVESCTRDFSVKFSPKPPELSNVDVLDLAIPSASVEGAILAVSDALSLPLAQSPMRDHLNLIEVASKCSGIEFQWNTVLSPTLSTKVDKISISAFQCFLHGAA